MLPFAFTFPLPPSYSIPTPTATVTMHEVSRLLQAATALSQLLRDAGVPHAFHGNVLTALLSKAPMADVCNAFERASSPTDAGRVHRK